MSAFKSSIFIILISSVVFVPFFDIEASGNSPGSNTVWKAGVAREVITPEKEMWMAGYSRREKPSTGKLHDLWAKVLILEDSVGQQAILITTDLLGIPKIMSDRIRDRLKLRFGLSRAQILINSSHTHSGPVLSGALVDIYPAMKSDHLERVEQYSLMLEDKLVALAGKALRSMKPAQLYTKVGVTRFQVNRRNNRESTLDLQMDLSGPNDYAVPVIKVTGESGNLMAIVFGYACHPTVLSGYEWSGDYPGFAQIELEKSHPGATAMFFQGAGADQNPLPRGSVALAQQYGLELTAAVDRVLNEDMQKQPAFLSTAYSEVTLPLTSPPTDKELKTARKEWDSGYQKRWASRLLKKIKNGDSLQTSYAYPVQVWRLGSQPVISLGGELVIEYAIRLKQIFGKDIFVIGYSNDVMGYIPSNTILQEGGYEGATSQMVYGLPSTWAQGIETLIIQEVLQLANQTGIAKYESKLIKN